MNASMVWKKVFSDRPFVTVIGDNGKEVVAHASRFEVAEEEK